MHVSRTIGYVYALSASAAVVISCAGADSQRILAGQIPTGQQRPLTSPIAGVQSDARPFLGLGYMDAGAKRVSHVFVSDATGDVVDVFAGTKQTGQITGFNEPQGLATDLAGTLYVANTDANNVEEFAPPYSNTPTAIISDGSGSPVAVAVSSNGIVAVLNICSGPSCSLPGNVAFYANGNRTLPCEVVRGGVAATPLGGAFDHKNTLYLGALNSGRVAQVSEIRDGCNARTITALTTSNTISFPADVQVDRSGNVAVLDVSAVSSAQIDIYAPPTRHSKLLTLQSTAALVNAASPISFALTATGDDLFTADAGAHQAMEYAYPAGGNSVLQLNPRPPGLFEGVAVTPAEPP
jgi:DNA-binding beta-propeller fold protein YncE